MKKEYRSFEDARKFVRKLKLKLRNDWLEYAKSVKRPKDIPSNPNTIYKNKGWVSMGDFLGTGTVSTRHRQYLKFNVAKKFVQSLKLKNQDGWKKYCNTGKKLDNIPSFPNQVYKNKGWISMGDFLGTGNVAPKDKKYISFEDAKKIVQNVGLKSTLEWRKYCTSKNKPNSIPTHPHVIYKTKGWKDWGDFLGTGNVAPKDKKYISFDKARKIIQSKNLKSRKEWRLFTKDPKFPKEISKGPELYYKNKGWKGMGDWLGTGIIQPQLMKYRSFDDAKKFVHALKLKNRDEWFKFCNSDNKPEDIPYSPDKVYKNKGWKRMGDWLGTGTIASQEISKNYLPWPEAKKEYRRLHVEYGLNNLIEWTILPPF